MNASQSLSFSTVQDSTDAVRGRVVYLFTAALALNLGYPISLINEMWATVYLAAYIVLLGAGVYVASVTRARFLLSITVMLATLAVGIPWVRGVDWPWLDVATYAMLTLFDIILILILLEFIFACGSVTRGALYAGITIYILIGNAFISGMMLLEVLHPGSFLDPAQPDGATFTWQQMSYYSFVTLATLGYGDIRPVTPWARVLAATEANIGTLYVAVLIGRLVGLHNQRGE